MELKDDGSSAATRSSSCRLGRVEPVADPNGRRRDSVMFSLLPGEL